MERDTIHKIILSVIREFNEQVPEENRVKDVNENDDIKLYGTGGALDSIGLINFIMITESIFSDKHAVSVNLADESLFSGGINHFETNTSIVNYIYGLLGNV